MLHITNGDSAASTIAGADLGGDVLPWQDALHDGPVPAGLALNDLSEVRARYLASTGLGDVGAIRAELARRDATLVAAAGHDEVVLWFEHDLYDQLQLLQLLDWIAGHPLSRTRLSLICLDRHPDVPNFRGLGQLAPAQFAALFPFRVPLSAAAVALGQRAWAAFRSPDPTAIERMAVEPMPTLPFLGAALRRHLEQFPGVDDGLSRTERQLLAVVADGHRHPVDIFVASQRREEAPFQGDTSVWRSLGDLSAGPRPLLTVAGRSFAMPQPLTAGPSDAAFAAQPVTLTPDGEAALAGRLDRLAVKPIDRWVGGVHLRPGSVWRWDRDGQRLV